MSQAAFKIRDCEAQENALTGRSNGSRLAGIIFLLIVLSVMISGGLVVLKWMNDTAGLPLSKLVVTGQMHYTTNDDIRRAILALGEPGTFMSQDVNVIQQQIERLPWIQQAYVRKQCPDELKIRLFEYVPVARWNDMNMVNAEGKSFSVPNNYLNKESMPMLYGPEGSESEVLNGYHQMKDLLTASKLELKVALMTARRSWQLVLEDDTRLELGRNDDMNRLKRFIKLLPTLQKQGQVENKRISYVDLRYDSGAAVGWAPVPISTADSNQQ